MTRRFFALTLVLCLCILSFTACSGTVSEPLANSGSSNQLAVQKPADGSSAKSTFEPKPVTTETPATESTDSEEVVEVPEIAAPATTYLLTKVTVSGHLDDYSDAQGWEFTTRNDVDSYVWTCTYDERGNRISRMCDDGAGFTGGQRYEYDENNNNIKEITIRNGEERQVITRTYYDTGEVKDVTEAIPEPYVEGGGVSSYTAYDIDGNVTHTWTKNIDGEIISEQTFTTETNTASNDARTYDDQGRILTITTKEYVDKYEYSPDDKQTICTRTYNVGWGPVVYTSDYDDNHNLMLYTIEHYTLDNLLSKTEVTEYTRDDRGNILTKTEKESVKRGMKTLSTETYSYTSDGLLSEKVTTTEEKEYKWIYDEHENLIEYNCQMIYAPADKLTILYEYEAFTDIQ